MGAAALPARCPQPEAATRLLTKACNGKTLLLLPGLVSLQRCAKASSKQPPRQGASSPFKSHLGCCDKCRAYKLHVWHIVQEARDMQSRPGELRKNAPGKVLECRRHFI